MSLENIISFLISAECYNTFFLEYNLLHVGCLKLSVSKFLGYGIIFGSLLVKVPQILKLWLKKSGEGISIFAQLLELYSVVVNAAYNWVNRFPFSSWGESLFMLLQTKVILTLVLYYGGMEKLAVTFVVLSISVIIILFSGILAIEILWLMQAVTVPVMFAGKVSNFGFVRLLFIVLIRSFVCLQLQ